MGYVSLPEGNLIHLIPWIYPPPRLPVANEGLGWASLLKM